MSSFYFTFFNLIGGGEEMRGPNQNMQRIDQVCLDEKIFFRKVLKTVLNKKKSIWLFVSSVDRIGESRD